MPPVPTSSPRSCPACLFTVRLLHTLVWAFFAGCILLLPIAAALHRFRWAALLAAFVLLECTILFCNRMRCPLTDLAARYTEDRTPNFDIFLPRWLARYNQVIFGTLFVINGLAALLLWLCA